MEIFDGVVDGVFRRFGGDGEGAYSTEKWGIWLSVSLPKSGLFAINASLEDDLIFGVGSDLWDWGGVLVDAIESVTLENDSKIKIREFLGNEI